MLYCLVLPVRIWGVWLTGQGGWAGEPLQKYVRIFFARQFFNPCKNKLGYFFAGQFFKTHLMLRQVLPRWAVEVRVGLEDGECVRRWRWIHIMRVVLLDCLSTMIIRKEISVYCDLFAWYYL